MKEKSTFAWMNGQFIPYEQASLQLADLSIQRGYGIFDFFRVTNGRVLFMDDHLERLYRSAKAMYLPLTYRKEALQQIVEELIERNQMPESGIRIELTGGYSPNAYTIVEPNIFLTQQELHVNNNLPTKGLRLKSCLHQRQLPHIKTIDYLMAIRTLSSPDIQGIDDLLYYNPSSVTECPRANFFIVTKEGTLKTAKEQLLAGITRKKLLQLTQGKIEVQVGDLPLDEVLQAREAFVTGTTKTITPVTAIDHRPIGNGLIGPITTQLHTLLLEHVKKEALLTH